MATILFLGASVSQVPAMKAARVDGHRVVAVDGDEGAVGLASAHASAAIDFRDVGRVVEFARRERIDGVVAICSDRAVPPAAAVAESLGLAGVGTSTARRMTDKGAMRERLAEAGIRQPSHLVVDDETDLRSALDAVGRPAVLKPVDSGGQRGLFIVSSLAELRERLPATLAASAGRRALLEHYVDGTELNGIAVVRDGEPTMIVLSDRLRPPGPGFGVGWAHLFPSTLPSGFVHRVRETAVTAIRALGLRDGIAFPQLICDPDGEAWVVEVAARIGAGQMADLTRLATGVDLYRIAFRQALGEPVPDELVDPGRPRPLAVRFLTAEPGVLPTGRLVSVSGLEDVRSSPGVLEADLYLTAGETIRPVQVDADRRGYVIASAGDPEHALQLADAAAARLVVKTRL